MSRFKTTAYAVLSMLILFLLAGCHEDKPAHEEHAAQGEQGASLELSLNEGQKWQMDDHTRNSINAIYTLFDQGEPSTIEDFNAIGTEAETEINNLVAGCTMEGAAHDQLHLFLGVFIPKVKALSAEKNIDEAGVLYGEIDQLLSQYDQYFQ